MKLDFYFRDWLWTRRIFILFASEWFKYLFCIVDISNAISVRHFIFIFCQFATTTAHTKNRCECIEHFSISIRINKTPSLIFTIMSQCVSMKFVYVCVYVVPLFANANYVPIDRLHHNFIHFFFFFYFVVWMRRCFNRSAHKIYLWQKPLTHWLIVSCNWYCDFERSFSSQQQQNQMTTTTTTIF